MFFLPTIFAGQKIVSGKNVIILNKTPVHSAKTAQLQTMMKDGGSPVYDLIMESQKWMARNTARLLIELDSTELWLVGYSALREKGFFAPYREELKSVLKDNPGTWNRVYVFQHFSMNRFTIDLDAFVKQNNLNSLKLMEQIHKTGEYHKEEIF